MEDFSAFTSGERALLEALNRRGVRFILVGLSAAVLQGANTGTRDIDLWSTEIIVDDIPFRVLSPSRIVASKRAAGRKKDLAVIPALEEALAATEGIPDPRSPSSSGS